MTESSGSEEAQPRPLPADPRTRPADTLDALEERVLGDTADQGHDAENDTDEPAFEQDIDTADPDTPAKDPEEHSG